MDRSVTRQSIERFVQALSARTEKPSVLSRPDVLPIRDAQAREQAAYGVMQANEESAAAALAAQQVPQRAAADQARAEQEALIGTDYGAD